MIRSNEHEWLIEPLLENPTILLRPMFGCTAVYLDGLLKLVLADQDQPWNGLLIATSREHHASLLDRFGFLVSHPVLGKWLYLSAETDSFERDAKSIVKAIAAGDPRIGVTPKPRKKRRKKS